MSCLGNGFPSNTCTSNTPTLKGDLLLGLRGHPAWDGTVEECVTFVIVVEPKQVIDLCFLQLYKQISLSHHPVTMCTQYKSNRLSAQHSPRTPAVRLCITFHTCKPPKLNFSCFTFCIAGRSAGAWGVFHEELLLWRSRQPSAGSFSPFNTYVQFSSNLISSVHIPHSHTFNTYLSFLRTCTTHRNNSVFATCRGTKLKQNNQPVNLIDQSDLQAFV